MLGHTRPDQSRPDQAGEGLTGYNCPLYFDLGKVQTRPGQTRMGQIRPIIGIVETLAEPKS